MAPRRLLVTGGAGFIGSNFVHHWLRHHPGDRVVVLDALTYAGNRHNLAGCEQQPGFRFVHGDILDTEDAARLLHDERLDTVVHFAAESHVDNSISDPGLFVRTNVLGTQSLLDAARAAWSGAARGEVFLHISTDEVYGPVEEGQPPATEMSRYAPSSPYAASKAAADHLVRACHRTWGLPVRISHCSNNYGPWQFPEKLIPRVLTRALRGESLPVYGDGMQMRDWLHVGDHCRGLDAVLRLGRDGASYHFASGRQTRNMDLVQELCRRLDARFRKKPALAALFPEAPPSRGGSTCELILPVPDRAGHDRRYALDLATTEAALAVHPSVALEVGIAATVDWYLSHPAWWRAILDGSYQRY